MIVEVIGVGTELLLGQIENSNASHIGRRLAEEGLDCLHQVVVGDNLERLTDAIATATHRADVVIITGGIGPTQDDLTREAICAVAHRAMDRDEAHAAWIRERIASQGGTPRDNQLRMADLPEGAEPLPNRTGVALGVALDHDNTSIFALPGVPAEMKPMLDEQVLPRIRARAGESQILISRVIKTWGQGESTVSELLADLFETTNPSLAFLIADMEVHVRLTAKAEDEAAARDLITPLENQVRERLGEAVFAVDDETVESKILEGLAARGWTVTTREHATLGQVGARLGAHGFGAIFRGSVIAPGPDREPFDSDVLLRVGEAVRDPDSDTTRSVTMQVETPAHLSERTFRFGGDDERLRAFATLAGLHLLRRAVS